MPVAHVLRDVSPLEQLGWRAHFARYPPGDHLTQLLLARLLQLMYAVHAKKGKRVPDLFEIAPWLKPPLSPEEREQEHQDQLRDRARMAHAAARAA